MDGTWPMHSLYHSSERERRMENSRVLRPGLDREGGTADVVHDGLDHAVELRVAVQLCTCRKHMQSKNVYGTRN